MKWKKTYGEQISINFIDPRNTLMIAHYLWRQVRARNITIYQFFKHLLTNIKLDAIFVNGYYLEKPDDFDKIVSKMTDS